MSLTKIKIIFYFIVIIFALVVKYGYKADIGILQGLAVLPFLAMIIFFINGVKDIFQGIKEERGIKNVRNKETSKIRSAAIGLVELNGIIEPIEELTSPISGSKCVLYYYKIEDIKKNEMFSNKFYLTDETGKILVDPKGMEYKLLPKNWYGITKINNEKYEIHKTSTKINGNRPEFKKEKLDSDKIPKELYDFISSVNRGKISIKEYYLERGEKIYVLGELELKEDSENEKIIRNKNSIISHNEIMLSVDGRKRVSDGIESLVFSAIIFILMILI